MTLRSASISTRVLIRPAGSVPRSARRGCRARTWPGISAPVPDSAAAAQRTCGNARPWSRRTGDRSTPCGRVGGGAVNRDHLQAAAEHPRRIILADGSATPSNSMCSGSPLSRVRARTSKEMFGGRHRRAHRRPPNAPGRGVLPTAANTPARGRARGIVPSADDEAQPQQGDEARREGGDADRPGADIQATESRGHDIERDHQSATSLVVPGGGPSRTATSSGRSRWRSRAARGTARRRGSAPSLGTVADRASAGSCARRAARRTPRGSDRPRHRRSCR